MLDGSSIAAILTGILALLGALGTAWYSGWNEHRIESRANRKALARYSVPLLIASWDLANWLYDILDDANYSPTRCEAYGDGWNSQFTSYLFGQYFAGVHIVREMTQFLAYIKGGRADLLKKLLWKIQDEFISMHYEGRENLELRWSEGDMLAVQEQMTIACGQGSEEKSETLRTMGWVEFQQNYDIKESKTKDDKSKELKKIFDWYEVEFQRIIFRRFKYLYSTTPGWRPEENPQSSKRTTEESHIGDHEAMNKIDEEVKIGRERQRDPNNIVVVVPDHRVRRLQHLLSDLVSVLDEVSSMKFNLPKRTCDMMVKKDALAFGTTDRSEYRVPCDCSLPECNPEKKDFTHRALTSGRRGLSRTGTSLQSRPQTLGLVPTRNFAEKDNSNQC
jgi:hypothetical protein